MLPGVDPVAKEARKDHQEGARQLPRSWLILLRLTTLELYFVCATSYLVGAEPNNLPIATPESQGVDSRPLAECLRYIRSEHLRIHSLLMVRHGRVVLD